MCLVLCIQMKIMFVVSLSTPDIFLILPGHHRRLLAAVQIEFSFKDSLLSPVLDNFMSVLIVTL